MSNFCERIAAAARSCPGRIAVEDVGAEAARTTTYAALMEEAFAVSGWLKTSGVEAGDRIAMLGPNSARWVAVYLGAMAAGIVVVPLDTAYSAAQVTTLLTDSGARVLFAGPKQDSVARDATRDPDAGVRLVTLPAGAETAEWSAATPATGIREVSGGDAAVILYTSGTTADPKGVVLTHANLDAEREAVLSVVSASARDVVLGVLPLFHALAEMANLWLPLSIGARVVFLETINSTTLLDALDTKGVTIFACVPQFFYLIHQRVMADLAARGVLSRAIARLLMALTRTTRDRLGWNPGRRIFARVHRALGPDMRLLITGGSRFEPNVARDLYGLGISLYNGYGLTETSGAATIVRPGDRFNTSVGSPLPGVQIRIGPAGASGDGEVLIRGPIVMREYFRRSDATGEALRDGWLHTGDLGCLDDGGRLHITGRSKDVIVLSSGKNLYPEEIEAHYRQSPVIKELGVVGLSRSGDPSGERLHALVVPNDQWLAERGIVNVRELIRFELETLSVRLPPHKRILTYDIAREPLPRTTTGKLKRNELLRLVRSRDETPAGAPRPRTPEEDAWAAVGDRAQALARVAEHLHAPDVAPDANLELDLGLDSMERVELLTAVEARASARVPAEVRAAIFTVRQLIEAVERAPKALAPGAAPPAAGDLPWDRVLAEPPDPLLAAELRRNKTWRAWIIYAMLRAAVTAMRVVATIDVRGRSNLPEHAPFILAPNHQTFLDGFFVAAALPFRAFRQIAFVGAAEFFETPLMAWGARAVNIVPLDPDANLVNAMQTAATAIGLGKVLMLFPEGERSIDGRVKPFRKGAAILASHTGAPVVPVALDGLFPLWPRGRAFQWRALAPWRRLRITIAFGAPLSIPQGRYTEGTRALEDAVRAAAR